MQTSQMKTKKPAKSQREPTIWSDTIPGLQVAWDSTSLRDLLTCPRMYELHMVQGWVPKKRPPALHFGITYHRGVEVYEKEKFLGSDFNAALRAAMRAAFEEWGDYVSDDNRRTKFTLARSLVWYADKYINDAAVTLKRPNGKPAVELGFNVMLHFSTPDSKPYFACGRVDRIARYGDDIRVVDAKSTVQTLSDKYFRLYDLDLQMDLYDYFGTVAFPDESKGLMIDACQTAVNFSRHGRDFSDRRPAQREEFMNDLQYWIQNLAEPCAMDGEWPMNKTSCSKFGGCTYREVCKREPSVRNVILESEFKVEKWNPLQSRGD